jgi:biotin transporter BioY
VVGSVLAPSAGHVLGWAFVSVVTGILVTWRLAPRDWRPSGTTRAVLVTAATSLGAYLAVSLGFHFEWTQSLDWDVFQVRLGAHIHKVDVWLVGAFAALLVMAIGRRIRRSR